MPREERLQKVLAHAGVASRRGSEEYILQGRVSVNGRVVRELGTKVDPEQDEVRVDGQLIAAQAKHTYVMLNKPKGYLSVMEDERGRRALDELITSTVRLYPVGRLDLDSEGLILLTDDGELANLLTHPRFRHDKEYVVRVHGQPSPKTLDAWRRGVVLEGKTTARAKVDVLQQDKNSTVLRVIIREGRKRQIRRVAALLGHHALELKRVRLGPLQLGPLSTGKWRYLRAHEIQKLESLKRRQALRRKGGRKPQQKRRKA